MTQIVFSPDQISAMQEMKQFVSKQRDDIFVLHGLAGSGKTTVMAEAVKHVPGALVCAPTGKAAHVLRTKTGLDVQTIHGAFYKMNGKTKGKDGRDDLEFTTTRGPGTMRGKFVFLDECSMVSADLVYDILRCGCRIIATGDPGQLRPVNGKSAFDAANYTLTTIHRQARESAIIRQAHKVRHGANYSADGPDFRVANQAEDADVARSMLLCWTNRTRTTANKHAREIRGFWQANPTRGEPVVALRNRADLGIFNGAVYELGETFVEGDTHVSLIVDGQEVTVDCAYFKGFNSRLEDNDHAIPFDFGYCLTVHKSQGSEWGNVVLLDEYRRAEDRAKWLYTGITRASKRILVVR